MFLAAANKPIFLSNPYPFRAEYQSKPMLKSLSIIDRERWSEWLFKHYVICLCVKWRADTWTWWWWFGAAWVPRDGSILYLRPSPRDCLHGPSTLLFSCFSLWCHRCTVFSSVQCLSAYPGLVERNKRRKNMCEAARNLKFCRCCESKLVLMG